jgi:HEXXH motif-containing protein
MTRYLVPTAAPQQGFTSGSDCFNPGVVAVSFPIDVVSLAESLVHETAHQYYFLMNCAAVLTDPGHEQLYSSPLRHTARPLDRILLAYHAVANIICLYQLLVSRDAPYQPDRSSMDRAVQDFETLADHLVDNPWLTDAGRALLEPIHNLIVIKQWTNFGEVKHGVS